MRARRSVAVQLCSSCGSIGSVRPLFGHGSCRNHQAGKLPYLSIGFSTARAVVWHERERAKLERPEIRHRHAPGTRSHHHSKNSA